MAEKIAQKVYKATVKMGRLIPVWNQDPKSLANDTYVSVHVDSFDGKTRECLLFTENQIEVARQRAAKNPEDCTKIGRIMTFMR